MKTTVVTLLLFFYINVVVCTLNSSLGTFVAVPYLFIGVKSSYISGSAIGAIPFDGCSLGERERIEGKILVVSEGKPIYIYYSQSTGRCDPAVKGKYAAETGAIAVVIVNTIPTGINAAFPTYLSAAKEVDIPVMDIIDPTGTLINYFSSSSNIANVTLTPGKIHVCFKNLPDRPESNG